MVKYVAFKGTIHQLKHSNFFEVLFVKIASKG